MARRKEGARALGPYEHNNVWRVIEVAGDGSKKRRHFETEGQARAYKSLIEQEIENNPTTVGEALDDYAEWLQRRKRKAVTIYSAKWAVASMFDEDTVLIGINLKACKDAYRKLVEKGASVSTHRGALARTKTFLRWCQDQGYITKNHLLGVSGEGKRNKRKKQLKTKDARLWYAEAMRQAKDGRQGSLAALMALLCGMRASEITGIRVGDLDDVDAPCDTVHVVDAKTDAGVRPVAIDESIRELIAALANGRAKAEWLFFAPKSASGRRYRDWPCGNVQRICKTVGVEEVCAHAMRGLLADIALERGEMGSVVAQFLGHTDEKVTRGSYAKKGAGERSARQKGHGLLTKKGVR